MRHTHADLIHAWAEGAKIQVKVLASWLDISNPNWTCEEYRIKPKEKVKKWKWLYRHGDTKVYSVTTLYYESIENLQAGLDNSCIALQKIEDSMIEVEE